MTMQININEVHSENAPKLKNPEFVVDYNLKDSAKPFPSWASYIVFSGPSRSGKTS